jgi:hypothetical protein
MSANRDDFVVLDGDVSPPIPGRNTHLPREREESEGGAATVASGDNEQTMETAGRSRRWIF